VSQVRRFRPAIWAVAVTVQITAAFRAVSPLREPPAFFLVTTGPRIILSAGLLSLCRVPDKDNNVAERAIRTPVADRKNYNGSGSRWAADLAGHAWTILGTARIAGHNPRAYLDTYLQACAANGGRPPAGQELQALLPWKLTMPGDRKDQPP